MENNNLTGNTAPEVANPQNEQLEKLQNALMQCEAYVNANLSLIQEQMEKAGVKPRFKKGSDLSELKAKMIDYLREWSDDNEHDWEEKIEHCVETTLCWECDWNEQQGQMSINKEVSGHWQVGYDIAEKFVNDFFLYQLEQEGGAK